MPYYIVMNNAATQLNDRQSSIVAFVASNPGCTKWAAAKADYPGRGHAASYAAIDRLIRRGALTATRLPSGRYELAVR